MRIDPSAIYSQYKKQISKTEEQPSVRGGKISLQEGQQVKGQILDVHQGGAKIRLSDGQVINAKLSGEFQFTIGENVQFLVKDTSSGVVVLSPDANVAEQMASKLVNILANAGLPNNEENQALVKMLVKNNMPIDSESIKSMIQVSKQHPDATMKQLVFMVKHQIPVTGENINQLQMLENNEHALMKSIASLTQDVAQAEVAGGNEQLLQQITGDKQAITYLQNMSSNVEQLDKLVEQLAVAKGQEVVEQSGVQQLEGQQEQLTQQTNNLPLVDGKAQLETTAQESKVNVDASVVKVAQDMIAHNSESANTPIRDMVMGNDFSKLSAMLSDKAGLLIDETTTMNDLANLMKEGMIRPEQLRDFASLLKEGGTYMAVAKGLLASESQLLSVEELKTYFTALHDKVSHLVDPSSNLLDSESAAAKEAVNVKASVEFMSAINQDYNLLHLPMLLGDTLLNSEMYIMNDKKTNLKDNDSLTALVRLDLLNLGHTDIYVKKTGKNVDAKFYMSDESQIPVVNEHLYKLHKMLNNKGFNVMGLQAALIEEAFDVKKDFLEQDGNQSELKRYTFDMRA